MQPVVEFYKKDIEVKNLEGQTFVRKDVLHFRFRQESPGSGSVLEIDEPATEQHKKGYPTALNKLLKSFEKPAIVATIDQVIEASIEA